MFTNKKRADIKHLFVLFSSMSLKHLNPQLKTMNLHSPYYLSALSRTVLLDNLSRNSCMLSVSFVVRFRHSMINSRRFFLTKSKILPFCFKRKQTIIRDFVITMCCLRPGSNAVLHMSRIECK